jgi:hypothetical protein
MDLELRHAELKWSDIHSCNQVRKEASISGFLRVSHLKGTLVPLAARGQSQFLG